MEIAKDTDKGVTRVQKGEEYTALGMPVYVWSGSEDKSKKIQKAWTPDRDRSPSKERHRCQEGRRKLLCAWEVVERNLIQDEA